MHRVCQQVHHPHALRGPKEGLQEGFGPGSVPPQHRNNLTHFPVAEPAELFAEVPRSLAQHLLPCQPLKHVEAPETPLAPLHRVQHRVACVLLEPDGFEVLEERSVQEGLQVEKQASGALGKGDFYVVRLEQKRDFLVDFASHVPQLHGQGTREKLHGRSCFRHRHQEVLNHRVLVEGLALFEGCWRRDGVGVGAFFEAGFEAVTIEFELVELLLELPHGVHESGSFEKGFVAFPCGVEQLVGEFRHCHFPLFLSGSRKRVVR